MSETITQQSASETELREFVEAGANTPAIPEWAIALSDAELVDARADWLAVIEEHEAQLRPLRNRVALLESVLLKRLTDRGASVLAHPDYTVSVERKDQTDVLVSECMPLFELAANGDIDPKDLAKALWWETPAPVLRKHLTYLKQLVKKYGAPVQAILSKAIRTAPGAPKLVIEPKPREQKKIEAAS